MFFKKVAAFVIIFCGSILPQQIHFCQSVNAAGKPIDSRNNWELKKGAPVCILFDYAKPINSSMVYMFVDRMMNGNYEAYDSKAISADKNKTWISYSYSFTESGKYDVYFINNSGERLAQNKITIKVSDTPPVENPAVKKEDDRKILTTDIIFCDNVVSNKPINVKESVSLKAGGTITVYIRSQETFNTNKLIVHIYKKTSSVIEDLVQTKKFKAQTNWRNIFFKYKFDSPGEYKFSVYDELENIIKSATFIVTQ